MSKLNLGGSLILDTDYSVSNTEKTGETWNGEPIYRRVIDTTVTPSGGIWALGVASDVNTSTAKVIRISGFLGSNYPIPWLYTDNGSVQNAVWTDVQALAYGGVRLLTYNVVGTFNLRLIIEYVKLS